MADQINRPNTQNQWRIGVKVQAVATPGQTEGTWVDLGTFDQKEGGAVDSEDNNYSPGGMGEPIPLGSKAMTENVSVERLYDLDRDHVNLAWLMSRAGKAKASVGLQPLDPDGNAYGDVITYAGKLKGVTPPDIDSESNDPSKLGLEISCPGLPI